MPDLEAKLLRYQQTHKLTSKGKLAAILYVSRLAKDRGLPLDSSVLVADSKGQVQGLGKTSVQNILKDYKITRVLAEEGGRTSRGSLGNMHDYVAFLNQLAVDGHADPVAIESWWVDRVRDFFTALPFALRYDAGKSLQYVISDLLGQAIKRQKENPGMQYAGAVLQHLVGASLSLVLPVDMLNHHGFSVSDLISLRGGDFVIDEAIIHVTTAPSEALIRKCQANLFAGCRPMIVTLQAHVAVAEGLLGNQGISGRVDVLAAEQFIATNLYNLSLFKLVDLKTAIERLVTRYNEIVRECETDPSLQIAMG